MSASEKSTTPTSNIIHVTGFGPFRGFRVKNPSWEAVSLLPDKITCNNKPFWLKKHQVSVEYDAVNELVPKFWSDNPTLVIHCGVNHKINKINLEQNAFNKEFKQEDCKGKCLACPQVNLSNAGSDCKQLCTTLDLTKVINECDQGLFERSLDPGNYLCGYIYLKSLDIDPSRCLFIHVPPIDKELTVQVISNGILSVIYQCLKQLDEKKALENINTVAK